MVLSVLTIRIRAVQIPH